MVYVIKDLLTACEQGQDHGERNCPKHVEFQSKNKFEKLVHLVGFIVRHNSVFKVKQSVVNFNPLKTEKDRNYT